MLFRSENGDGEAPQYYQAETEADEALYCARIIAAHASAGGAYSDFAVLMRINALTRAY